MADSEQIKRWYERLQTLNERNGEDKRERLESKKGERGRRVKQLFWSQQLMFGEEGTKELKERERENDGERTFCERTQSHCHVLSLSLSLVFVSFSFPLIPFYSSFSLSPFPSYDIFPT